MDGRGTDGRLLRDADADHEADLAAAGGVGAGGPGLSVARTTSDATYPTTAGKFVKCELGTITGTEAEGTAGTTTWTGRYVYAYALTTPPTQGTTVLVRWADYRWVLS